ncbi:hypothetical protein LTR36_005216 [Oleoguttula mirabilis]|uniref:J domain-containing protein n=1 Tax=Oleoguttula mirabilis TaxID=1507867 RepID=A0AAV9JWC9_9PEZI|nr:hypothetical protein LTR36_005216 [Oleoguttula mirabilis]
MPNHYATLDLATHATPAEIKKQFYKLSKAHHPDLHPDNPHASQRFVQISEAHATLGSPDKKSKYDRDFLRTQHPPASSSTHPTGSYSSHSSPAGGRPASGLSRRRTQFHGPPPSFYRSGGWGQHSEKRAEHADKASHAHEAQGNTTSQSTSTDGPAGTGPGGFTTGVDNDVRHFDHQGHYRTHSTIERTRHKARRKQWQSVSDRDDLDYGGGSSMLFNFVLMSGVLGSIFGISYGLFGVRSGSGSSSTSTPAGKKKTVGKDADGAS